MLFEWDDAKNERNIRQHGIDFMDVLALFDGPMLTDLDDRMDYGENRWVSVSECYPTQPQWLYGLSVMGIRSA